VAQNTTGRRPAIDRRTTRHAGYRQSRKARHRIEEVFAWVKTIAGQQRLHELWRALAHFAVSLTRFDPDAKLELIRPKSFRRQADWAKRGEHARRVLHVLRRANGEPLTMRAITLQVMTERGLDVGRPKLVREITRRLSYTLRCQRDSRLVMSERGTVRWPVWRLVTLRPHGCHATSRLRGVGAHERSDILFGLEWRRVRPRLLDRADHRTSGFSQEAQSPAFGDDQLGRVGAGR
jgi:hypothetical protein